MDSQRGARRVSGPVHDLGFARLDTGRAARTGVPEVVFAEYKTPDQVAELLWHLAETDGPAFATRASPAHFAAVLDQLPSAVYHEPARIIQVPQSGAARPQRTGTVLVVAAGTSDLPVAEEAAVTAALLGNPVDRLFDVGVAGLHRLLAERERLERAAIRIVVAGMEGALPSVVAGLVGGPVVAVPTSVGYGASFGGVAALLGMLSSCAPGVAVVNIDNGFGAAAFAHTINR